MHKVQKARQISFSTYTAPANGYFSLFCGASGYVSMQIAYFGNRTTYNGSCDRLMNVMAQQGQTMALYYGGTIDISSQTYYKFRFYYAEGSK